MPETENKENTSSEEVVTGNEDSRVYELGYLLVPTISEENAPAIFGNLKELIVELGGEIISSEMPRMIRLAYVMEKVVDNVRSKFDSAYFGWIKFEVDPEKMEELKKKLDSNNDLIRFLIIKTVRENTIAPKRFAGSSGRMKTNRKEEKEEAVPIDKEEVDKEIDAMVEEVA